MSNKNVQIRTSFPANCSLYYEMGTYAGWFPAGHHQEPFLFQSPSEVLHLYTYNQKFPQDMYPGGILVNQGQLTEITLTSCDAPREGVPVNPNVTITRTPLDPHLAGEATPNISSLRPNSFTCIPLTDDLLLCTRH